MEDLITIEVKIYPRLRTLNRNTISVGLEEGSDMEALMKKLCSIAGEEFQDRFYQDGKCKSLIFLNEKKVDLKTAVKDKDAVTLVPIIGGG